MEVPEGMLVAGVPAQVKREITGTPSEFWVKANPGAYADLAQRHRAGIQAVG
jgi:carbonic anhydrase/acetyltransferase-like protein (isoleucine patch superfamily)